MKIVIIGAGVGGIIAYQNLRHSLNAKITLIDDNEAFLFTPRLTEVLSGSTPEKYIVRPVKIFKCPNTHVEIDKVQKVDLKKQIVHTKKKKFQYDYLIFAQGARTNFFGIKNAKKFCHEFKDYEDATQLENKIVEIKKGKIAIVGGGPTGTEVAFAINDLLTKYFALDRFSVHLFQDGKHLVPALGKWTQKLVEKKAKQAKIDLKFGHRVIGLSKNTLKFKRKNFKADIIIWATGVTPNVIPTSPKLRLERNHIPVKNTLQIQDFDNVFAIGDCSSCLDSSERQFPPTAQIATRQGVHAAKNISRMIKGSKPAPFEYKIKGWFVALHRGRAAAETKLMNFDGKIGGLLRGSYYRIIFRRLIRKTC